MTEYLPIYIFITLVTVLIFLLLKLIIKSYFHLKSKKYSSKNYPVILGISLLLAPAFFYKSSSLFINYLIDVLENKYGYNLPPPPEDNDFLIWYLIFAIGVIIITVSYIYYYNNKKRSLSNVQREKGVSSVKNIYQAGITQYKFESLPENILEQEYLKSIFGSIKIFELNNDCSYSLAPIGLDKELLIILKNQQDDSNTITDNFRKNSSRIKKIIEPKKKKRTNINTKYLLFGSYKSELPDEISVIDYDRIIFNYKLFDGYIQKQIDEFTNKKVQYSYNEELSLKDIFVHPKAILNRSEKLPALDFLKEWIQDDKNNDQVIVSGEYGLGKTTLLKYLSYTYSRKIISSQKGVRIPIYIELSNEFPYRKGIDSVIFKFLKENNIAINKDLLGHLIYNGAFLFLLDGFDEIGYIGSNDERYNNLLSIWDLAKGKNKIIISGRLSYFESIDRENSILKNLNAQLTPNKLINNDLLNLQFFSEKEVNAFLRRKFTKKTHADKAYEFILKNRALQDMCARPYLLHLTSEMMIDLKNTSGMENLNAFQLIELYVNRWITRQQEKGIQSNFYDSNEKIEFIQLYFREIAKYLYENELSYKEIEMVFARKELVKMVNNSTYTFIEGATTQGIESEIFTSYFIERRDNKFSFVHKSIFEYFVAKAILDLIEEKKKNKPLFNSYWTNEILNLVYEGYDFKFGFDKTNTTIPLLLQKISTKASTIHKVINFLSKIYLKFRNVIFYSIFRNLIIIYILYACFFTNYKIGIVLTTFLLSAFSSIVRDPTDKILNIQNLNIKTEINYLLIILALIYSTSFFTLQYSDSLFYNFTINFLAFISTFVLMYSIFKQIFLFLNKRFLKSNRVKSVLKSYYSQILKEDLDPLYLTRILAFLNYVDSRPIVIEKKLIEADNCKLPLENIVFKNCTFRVNRLYNYNCTFDIAKFSGISFREIHFNKCKLHKLDLSDVLKVKMYRTYEKISKKVLGMMLEKFSLTNMKPGDIDQYSIRSLKKYLKSNNLDISAAKVDEWLMKEFK